jgi:hypothetical protein
MEINARVNNAYYKRNIEKIKHKIGRCKGGTSAGD